MKESDVIDILQALLHHPTLTTLILKGNSFFIPFIILFSPFFFSFCMYSFLLDTHSLEFLKSGPGGSASQQCSPFVAIAIAELISTNSVIQTLNLNCIHLVFVCDFQTFYF
jgi:hypothetical protein